MYKDFVDGYYNGLIPAMHNYIKASGENRSGSELRLPAIQAAHLLYHYREQIQPHLPPKTFMPEQVGSMIFDYELIGNVFNSTKHNPLQAPGKLLSDASSVSDALVTTYFETQEGFYSHQHFRVIVKPVGGGYRDLLQICINVFNGWSKYLKDNNHVQQPMFLRYTGDDFILKQQIDALPQPVAKANLKNEIVLSLIWREYDYLTNSFRECSYK